MADIVLINPRFEVSFWGMEHALPYVGKRANLPVACLPLLAALTPEGHTVTLMDENVEAIDFDRCAKADIVGITGMSVQRFRMKEIMAELKARGCFVVVGGPYVTVKEDYFEGLVDAIFIGEAEVTWPEFLREWGQGLHRYRYEQVEKTDMATVPTPRFDLLKMRHYAFGSLQFSRGCPFQCEFCDIIVTFGRRPRIKTTEQVLAELDAIRATGQTTVFIVDDNLIGNKKAIKVVLRAVIDWQRRHGYEMVFFTEASIDLADDPELMDLMAEANFISVFIGIESPSEEALRETKKLQNVRSGGTLLEKVHRIQKAGMEVWCGMIMGFDSDDATIFDRQIEFIKEARIAFSMSGMLSAIPKTPLYDRLAEEGRLDYSDTPECGTNVIPLQLSREELREGFVRVLSELYEPTAYFDRVDSLYHDGRFEYGTIRVKPSAFWSPQWIAREFGDLVKSIALYGRLMKDVPQAELRRIYKERFWKYVRTRPRPAKLLFYVFHLAMHYHAYTMATDMSERRTAIVNSY
ncbi:MAG: B12-binding domain-containing radical SAM protein [Isosphaeraceae bacterium]